MYGGFCDLPDDIESGGEYPLSFAAQLTPRLLLFIPRYPVLCPRPNNKYTTDYFHNQCYILADY